MKKRVAKGVTKKVECLALQCTFRLIALWKVGIINQAGSGEYCQWTTGESVHSDRAVDEREGTERYSEGSQAFVVLSLKFSHLGDYLFSSTIP